MLYVWCIPGIWQLLSCIWEIMAPFNIVFCCPLLVVVNVTYQMNAICYSYYLIIRHRPIWHDDDIHRQIRRWLVHWRCYCVFFLGVKCTLTPGEQTTAYGPMWSMRCVCAAHRCSRISVSITVVADRHSRIKITYRYIVDGIMCLTGLRWDFVGILLCSCVPNNIVCVNVLCTLFLCENDICYLISSVFTALHWMQDALIRKKLSVCLSICQTCGSWQNGSSVQIFIPYDISFQTWSSRDLNLGLETETRFYKSWSRSRSWDLWPWRLGLCHSGSVKLRQNRKSNYGFLWLDADHPGDDSVKKTITSAIIFEAEQCCSTAELETASQSACALWAVHQWGKYGWSSTIETVPIFTVCFLWET